MSDLGIFGLQSRGRLKESNSLGIVGGESLELGSLVLLAFIE